MDQALPDVRIASLISNLTNNQAFHTIRRDGKNVAPNEKQTLKGSQFLDDLQKFDYELTCDESVR